MRSARLYLPVALCLLAIAAVVVTGSGDVVKGVLLIAAAAVAIGVLDVLFLRRGRPLAARDDEPADGGLEPEPRPRR